MLQWQCFLYFEKEKIDKMVTVCHLPGSFVETEKALPVVVVYPVKGLIHEFLYFFSRRIKNDGSCKRSKHRDGCSLNRKESGEDVLKKGNRKEINTNGKNSQNELKYAPIDDKFYIHQFIFNDGNSEA